MSAALISAMIAFCGMLYIDDAPPVPQQKCMVELDSCYNEFHALGDGGMLKCMELYGRNKGIPLEKKKATKKAPVEED